MRVRQRVEASVLVVLGIAMLSIGTQVPHILGAVIAVVLPLFVFAVYWWLRGQ